MSENSADRRANRERSAGQGGTRAAQSASQRNNLTADAVTLRPVEVVTRAGIVLRGDAYGEPEGRPVLLLHGGGQTRQSWRETALRLSRVGFCAVAMDLRGHGESDWSASGDYEFHAFAEDAVDLLYAQPRPTILVGASLGGIAGLVAVERASSSSCGGLVLVDVAPRIEPAGAARVLQFMAAHPNGFGSVEEAAAAVASYNPRRARAPDLGNLSKNLRRRDDGRFVWHWDPRFLDVDRSRPGRFDILERAARSLRIPTLLVRGRESDLLSEEGVRDFLEMVPHARFCDVSGAGHMVVGDRNDVFAQAVLEFIRECCGA